MNVTAVDQVEFYVRDAPETARFLCEVFGFRRLGQGGPGTGLPGQRTLLLGQGGIRILVTSALAPDHPVARHVERHGDGLACVAMRTDDAAAAFERALADGAVPVTVPATWRRGDASVVTATVTGPGSVNHRLVQRCGDGPDFLPGGMDLLTTDHDEGGGPFEEVDHLALCVAPGDLEPTVQFYRRSFGLLEIFEERLELGDQAMDSKVVQSRSRKVTFTIVSPGPATSTGQLVDFLRANAGSGVQHLALSTRDITTAVRTSSERGVRFFYTPDSYYETIAERLGTVSLPIDALRGGRILADRDHWGEMFQIFTESPFERRTFFFELIERHGALTFGANNIRTLYEAKERASEAARASTTTGAGT